jgi:mRNA-degrading endonuclease YafQ of YafQ-DinJ toxin-antitoxin module
MVRKRSLSKPKPDGVTPDKPVNLFFPDNIRSQLSQIKKKDKPLFSQLQKRFRKLRTDPTCGEALSHDKRGYLEVHVKSHWVIIYRLDQSNHIVVIVKIGVHEKALGR